MIILAIQIIIVSSVFWWNGCKIYMLCYFHIIRDTYATSIRPRVDNNGTGDGRASKKSNEPKRPGGERLCVSCCCNAGDREIDSVVRMSVCCVLANRIPAARQAAPAYRIRRVRECCKPEKHIGSSAVVVAVALLLLWILKCGIIRKRVVSFTGETDKTRCCMICVCVCICVSFSSFLIVPRKPDAFTVDYITRLV